MLTYDDMTKIYIPDLFGTDEYDDITDEMEDVMEQLGIGYEDMAYGASKFVIFANDEEVFKIPFNGSFFWDYEQEESIFDEFQHIKDYCDYEADIYADAVDAGIEKMFAGTRFVGFTKDGTRFYASERIHIYIDYENEPKASKEGTSKLEEMRKNGTPLARRIDANWLASAIDCYGEEYVEEVLNFLHEKGVDDFHSGNMGYRNNGEPCFIDYSGYMEV